jgi:aminoglycoside phosphotransferase (APT) family kinase protein
MNGDDTMRKEARVLAALAGTDVPHPPLIAACPEKSVLGAAFYLMEPVAGFNATVALPALHAGSPEIRRQMGIALIDGLLQLGRVDYIAAGLETLGRIDGFLERQVGRWRSQLEGYAEYTGWPGAAALPGFETIAAWLEAHRPAAFSPGIMHGDYHLANVMYRNDSPALAAIVDWELATIGDPLIDLGWVLATWPDENNVGMDDTRVKPWDGFPTADELIAHYRAGTTRDLSHIGWYRVFACYKLGILLEGSFARACAGKAPVAIGDRLHQGAIDLFTRAGRLVAAH